MISYLLAGAAEEPVSLAQAKAFLKVDDGAEDGLIATLIGAARLHVEGTTGRALLAQSWRLVLDEWPENGQVKLPLTPFISIAAIMAYDAEGVGHAVPLAQFLREPDRLVLPPNVAGMPVLRERHGIEIDYVAGFGTEPEDVPADPPGTAGARGLLVRTSRCGDRGRVRFGGARGVRPAGGGAQAGAVVNGQVPPIGTLTDRVQLKRREMTGESGGGHDMLFVPVTSLWARVRSLSGREGVTADGRSVTVSHSVVLRFRNDVSPGDRIVYRGRNLDVVSAADLNGRRAYLSCTCSQTSWTG
jgi:uncharacterized phiE125 gp8 family phage protein/SPP1 family predicted phage head-tail adaptor